EMGYLPLDDLGSTVFFHLVSARYERGRSSRPPSWTACFTTRRRSTSAERATGLKSGRKRACCRQLKARSRAQQCGRRAALARRGDNTEHIEGAGWSFQPPYGEISSDLDWTFGTSCTNHSKPGSARPF